MNFTLKGTPQAIVDKLSGTLIKTRDTPATNKRPLDLGLVLPEERIPAYLAVPKKEVARWIPSLKDEVKTK